MTNITALNPNLDAAAALRDLATDMEKTQDGTCTVIVAGTVYQLGPSRDEAADALWNLMQGVKSLLEDSND